MPAPPFVPVAQLFAIARAAAAVAATEEGCKALAAGADPATVTPWPEMETLQAALLALPAGALAKSEAS